MNGQTNSLNKIKAWETEGDTLMSMRQYQAASKLYSKVIKSTGLKNKDNYNVLYKRAICLYYIEGQEDQALKDVDLFIQNFPDVAQPHILRALIYRIKENPKEQLHDLNAAISLQPSNAGLLKWRGEILLDQEKYSEAKKDIESAVTFEDDPESETLLGLAHFSLNNPDSALMSINKAIALDYSYLPSYLYAGSFCLQKNEYQLGLTYFNLGLRVDIEHPALLFYKGVSLIELKQKDEGCRFLNKAFYRGYDDAGDYIQQYCYASEDK